MAQDKDLRTERREVLTTLRAGLAHRSAPARPGRPLPGEDQGSVGLAQAEIDPGTEAGQ